MVLSCGCHQGHASYCFTNTVHTGWPHTIWNFCYPRVIFKLYPLPSSKPRLLGLNRWMGRQQTIQRTMHIFRQDWIGLSELAMRRWVLSSHPALEISVLICFHERHLCFLDPLLSLHTLFTFNDFRIWLISYFWRFFDTVHFSKTFVLGKLRVCFDFVKDRNVSSISNLSNFKGKIRLYFKYFARFCSWFLS